MRSTNKIGILRKKMGYTPVEFSALLGITYMSLWRYENRNRKPTLEVVDKMIRLAKKHDIEIDIRYFLKK